VNKTITLLAPRLGCEPGSITYDKLWYGTYVFYINVAKTLMLIVIALILGIFPYVAVFALAYALLRIYSFGVHLDSSILCTLVGLVYYLGSTYLSLLVGIPLIVRGLLMFISIGIFLTYAPAQTKKRPIPERRRKTLKIKSLLILMVITVIVFILRNYTVYSSLLCMAAICQSVNLLPITYKIFKER
jgi:accessory gene regulator B